MTQEEIKQFNLRCAEFRGYDMTKIVDEMPVNKHGDYCAGDGDLDADGNPCFLIPLKTLQFDSDWNHIMNVVNEIEATPRSKFSPHTFACVEISSITCRIVFYGNRREVIADEVATSKKSAVISAINQFITWYNQNKS